MKILIIGRGKMGTLLRETALKEGMEVLGNLDVLSMKAVSELPDVVLDFSHPDNLSWVLSYIKENHLPLVYGTTGLSSEELRSLQEAGGEVPIFYSPNFSFGVAVLGRLTKMAAALLKDDFDIELTETHHRQKQDAPSGTAKMLLALLQEELGKGPSEEALGEDTILRYGREGILGQRPKTEIGVHSLRGGTEAGEHTIHFFGDDETITISHRAQNRQIFVNGALKAARFIVDKTPGFYGMDDLLA